MEDITLDDLNYFHTNFETKNNGISQVPIILVEDDKILGKTIQKFLERKFSRKVTHYLNSNECLSNLSHSITSEKFCLITDISFEQGPDGLLLIDMFKERGFNFVSLVITGFASIENAISATKRGVYHYLTKPFELENLYNLVTQALEEFAGASTPKRKAVARGKLPDPPGPNDFFCGMIGRSDIIKDVFERIKKVALSDSTILITGPSGTGKELVAEAIHGLSDRSGNRFVSVNCGSIPKDLLERELFGHIKGSFTGAISNRSGRFELANGGSIFLDEIGDMPLMLQVKLLRVLQNREIEPVGSSEPLKIDTRIVAATHRDLEKLAEQGRFREDLFYRLNVIPIKVPALKDRREDIPLLISYFLSRFVSADGSNQIEFVPETLELLMSYDWPGNVRELENLVERFVILRGGTVINPEDLPAKIFRMNPSSVDQHQSIFSLPNDGINLKKTLTELEVSLIKQAMSRTNGNKNQASKLLGINRTTLIEKIKKKSIF